MPSAKPARNEEPALESSPEQTLDAHYAKMAELGQRRRDLSIEHHVILYPGVDSPNHGKLTNAVLAEVKASGGLEEQMKNLTEEAIVTTATLLRSIDTEQRDEVIFASAKAFYDDLADAYGGDFRLKVCVQFTLTAPAQNVNAGVTANAALEPDPDSARISGVVATAANDATTTNITEIER